MRYFQLKPDNDPPKISYFKPFKAVVVIEEKVELGFQNKISKWLVESGCLYMMAWGKECSSWDDSVDWATIDYWEGKKVPDSKFVMTTWHDDETLEEVFWFSKSAAIHPDAEIDNSLVLHISNENKEFEIRKKYKNA